MPRLLVGEAQLRAILDAIPSRVALYDRDRRHCYVNREYAAFVGRKPDEVIGLTLPEVMGQETYARLEPYYRQLRPHSAKALAGEPSRWEGWLPYSAQGEPCFVQRLYVPYGARTAPWTATSSSPAT
jgi:two-component system cell cycle sensor histidine kinase/response regulator CckA